MSLCSCQNSKKKYTKHQCRTDLHIDEFPDSSFFSDIRNMQYFDGRIYILDVNRRDIVSLDENFENMKIIGSPGPGPRELNVPMKFYLWKDTVFVFDQARGVKSFYQSDFIRQYNFQGISENRFFLTESRFYIPSSTDSTIFAVINKDIDNEIQYAGKIIQFDSKKETIMHNEKDLLYEKGDFFYAISDNITEVDKYDLHTLNLVSKFDLSDIPIVKNNLNYIQSQQKNSNSYYILFSDSYISDNSLYVMCVGLRKPVSSNHLVKIKLEPTPQITNIYVLPGRIYDSFCMSPNYIFAFNKLRNSIERIKIPN